MIIIITSIRRWMIILIIFAIHNVCDTTTGTIETTTLTSGTFCATFTTGGIIITIV